GKLLGSLLQIGLFLVGMVPILLLILLLGGVSGAQVSQATLILATTALAAGSLGGLIALWRDKTFQALALTVLLLVLYLCVVPALSLLAVFDIASADTVSQWQTWLQPFLALESVIDPPPRPAGELPPAYAYSLAMLGWCVLLNALGIWRLRAWNPSGEPI